MDGGSFFFWFLLLLFEIEFGLVGIVVVFMIIFGFIMILCEEYWLGFFVMVVREMFEGIWG